MTSKLMTTGVDAQICKLIVDKVKRLMLLCDQLPTNLTHAEKASEELMEAVGGGGGEVKDSLGQNNRPRKKTAATASRNRIGCRDFVDQFPAIVE